MISRQRTIGLILTGCVCAGIVGSGMALEPGETARVYDGEGRFIAVYRYDGERRKFVLKKMFLDPEEIRI